MNETFIEELKNEGLNSTQINSKAVMAVVSVFAREIGQKDIARRIADYHHYMHHEYLEELSELNRQRNENNGERWRLVKCRELLEQQKEELAKLAKQTEADRAAIMALETPEARDEYRKFLILKNETKRTTTQNETAYITAIGRIFGKSEAKAAPGEDNA